MTAIYEIELRITRKFPEGTSDAQINAAQVTIRKALLDHLEFIGYGSSDVLVKAEGLGVQR